MAAFCACTVPSRIVGDLVGSRRNKCAPSKLLTCTPKVLTRKLCALLEVSNTKEDVSPTGVACAVLSWRIAKSLHKGEQIQILCQKWKSSPSIVTFVA